MSKMLILSVLLFSFGTFAKTRFAHPNQLIVGFEGSAEALAEKLSDKGLLDLVEVKKLGKTSFHVVTSNPSLKLVDFLSDFKSLKDVSWVAPNYVYEGEYREFVPTDPIYIKQAHHKIIKSEEAWDISLGEKQIVVAVTDDGFKLDHEDLLGAWFQNPNEVAGNGIDDDNNGYVDDFVGWDFNENDNDPMSDSRHGSHGTHVAGIISAGFDNGVGVVGFGPMIKVMPLKFYGSNTWTSSMVLESYTYAADNGANIITTSYYIDNFVGDVAYEKALDYADEKGLLLFNSAGNGNARESARTKFTKLFLVASTKAKKTWNATIDQRSSFSNYGRGVDIAAPGDPIHSTGRSVNYVDMSGTSMASPNAAGLAALIWSVFPDYTRDQVAAKLMMSSENIDALNSNYKHLLGNGRIDALAALEVDLKPTFVREAFFDQSSKILNIHLRGLLDPKIFNRRGGLIIRKKGSESVIQTEFENEYHLATNVLKVSVEEAGDYEMIMKSQSFIDPFGQELDGNLNGNPGGDFQFEFEVR